MDFSIEIINEIAHFIKDDIHGYIDTHVTEYAAFLETRKEVVKCVNTSCSALQTSKQKKSDG